MDGPCKHPDGLLGPRYEGGGDCGTGVDEKEEVEMLTNDPKLVVFDVIGLPRIPLTRPMRPDAS